MGIKERVLGQSGENVSKMGRAVGMLMSVEVVGLGLIAANITEITTGFGWLMVISGPFALGYQALTRGHDRYGNKAAKNFPDVAEKHKHL